jgi:hypothetical protein
VKRLRTYAAGAVFVACDVCYIVGFTTGSRRAFKAAHELDKLRKRVR